MTVYDANEDNIGEVIAKMFGDTIDSLPKYQVIVDCPYAKAVEYGADPADLSSGTEMTNDDGDDITVRNKEIRDWVSRKFGLIGKERKKVGDRIYKNILIQGTPPQPFYRPAKHRMEEMLSDFSDEILSSDDPALLIAELTKTFMLENMMYKDIRDTGRLMRSIRVVPDDGILIPIMDYREDVENSDTLNYKGEEDRRTKR